MSENAPQNATLIELRDFHHTYLAGTPRANEALRGVSLEVRRGERIAIVGPTQSGKSTLVDALAALVRLGEGQVFFRDEDIAGAGYDRAELRREVGIVFQRPEAQVVEDIVGADVAFGPTAAGLTPAETRHRVEDSLNAVGLPYEEYRLRYTHALSGGQKRRVAIAGVLSMRPSVFVLDEPMAGLDPRGRHDVLELLNSLSDDEMTLIVCSTSLEEISLVCDRIVVLDEGRVALDGPLKRVLEEEVERLASLGVTLPEVAEYARELRSVFPDFPTDLLTRDRLEEELLARVGL